MKQPIRTLLLCCLTLLPAACTHESDGLPAPIDPDVMTFSVTHPAGRKAASTRVTSSGFETDDRIGLFIVSSGEPLQASGNYVNNAALVSDGTDWTTAEPIYWDNGTYDVFAYYPYTTPVQSVDDMPFRVAADQHTDGTDALPGGYEASDLLFASAIGVQASGQPVPLMFRHCMSRMQIRLVKGDDFEGELPQDAEVYVHNTVPQATVSLSAGIVTRDPYATTQTIRAKGLGQHRYAAIIVPQRITNRQPLVEVVMKGVSYLYESTFVFKPGTQHNVSLLISKNPEQVKIEIGGELEDWEE